MPKISLLSSVHAENGLCSSSELCRILERLAPDVLFQEIAYFEYLRTREEALRHPARNFSIQVKPPPLEISAITEYLNEHELLQIPVEPLRKSESRSRSHNEVFDWVLNNSPNLRRLLDEIHNREGMFGFPYVNSLRHTKDLNNFDAEFWDSLKFFQRQQMSETYADWHDYNAHREASMIKNIVEFSTRNDFDSAVFLFGAAHRQGLIREIQKIKKSIPVEIAWKLYH